MRSRAFRRHHRRRMIERAKHVTRRWWGSYEPWQYEWKRGIGRVLAPKGIDHTQADKQAVRLADHLQTCSCAGCGNPRRHHGQSRVKRGMGWRNEALTMQERRAALDWDQVAEFFAGALDDEPVRA